MKNRTKGTMQIRNKIKSKIDPGGQTVIEIDDEEEKLKVKRKKRKHLEKEKAADQMMTKKKKKKKHSKLKRGCADHPIIIESNSDLKSSKAAEKIIIEGSSDSESIKETGKAPKISKKGRRLCHERGRTPEVPDEDLSEVHREIHSLSKKSCKRTIPASQGDDQEFAPKKKKKKKHQPTCSVMLQSVDNEDESRKPFSKKTKLTSQEGELLSGNKKGLILLNATRNCDVVKKKHKGLCYLASVDSQGSSNGIGSDGYARTVSHECSCQGRALACRQHPENVVENETQKKVVKKKKKKKKEKLKSRDVASVLSDNQGSDSENLLGTKSERKIVGREDVMSLMQDTEGVHPVIKKKKMQAKVENDCPAHVEDHRGTPTNGKEAAVERMKKKAKEVPVHNDPCGFTEVGSKLHARKGKGRKSDSSKEEPKWKEAKMEEVKEGEEEIKIVSVKEGNCDEVSIDKSRRQALQKEIDWESGKTKAPEEEGESDAHFGQWSTATFESSERKNKFLRLLGGFKNGSASAHSSLAHATKPNMALARTGEKWLLQNLQAEFDKARDLKQFRGTGLGFQSAPQKRVFIDKYASKSIKFES